jgi:hypothetical protein
MVGEVYVLRSHLSAVVGADLYLPDEAFELSHEPVDMIVSVTLCIGYHVAEESRGLHSFFFFIKIWLVLIGIGDLVPFFFVEPDFLDDVEHLKDIQQLLSEKWSLAVGFSQKFLNRIFVEFLEEKCIV